MCLKSQEVNEPTSKLSVPVFSVLQIYKQEQQQMTRVGLDTQSVSAARTRSLSTSRKRVMWRPPTEILSVFDACASLFCVTSLVLV